MRHVFVFTSLLSLGFIVLAYADTSWPLTVLGAALILAGSGYAGGCAFWLVAQSQTLRHAVVASDALSRSQRDIEAMADELHAVHKLLAVSGETNVVLTRAELTTLMHGGEPVVETVFGMIRLQVLPGPNVSVLPVKPAGDVAF